MSTTTATSGAIASAPVSAGMGWRVTLSIATVFGWLSFVLLYVGFWAERFSSVQSIVIILVSLFAFAAINGAAWASWGTRPERGYAL